MCRKDDCQGSIFQLDPELRRRLEELPEDATLEDRFRVMNEWKNEQIADPFKNEREASSTRLTI